MIGKILGGRYELLEKIGTGGMAVVYRAKCLLLNRTVAVKILRDDLDSSDEFLKRFNIEAQSAASLTNQHIVSIYDVGKDGDVNYIVMEFVEGKTLKEYIKFNNPVPWQQAVKITMGIADALTEAHKKHIIHRDIKPQNIIVTDEGDIKVTDFGIARVSSGETISVDGDVLGSVHYLSPEQARGGYVDERSDIYSLGVVMYEMLTGKVPFDGDTPVAVAMKQIEQPPVNPCEIVDGIPENASAIVLKAMCKEVSCRYASVTEMLDDLKAVLTDPGSVSISTRTYDDYLDDATKKMQAVKIDTISEIAVKEENKPKERVKISSNDKKTIASAVITSLIIVGLLSVFAASMIFTDFQPLAFLSSFSSQEIEVPDLVALTVDEAEEKIAGTEFTLIIKESNKATDQPIGTIIEQYPRAGRRVKGAQSIEITVAMENTGIKLNNYKNEDYKTAEKELISLGLNVNIEKTKSEEIAEDYVISQNPAEGASLNEGDTVTLYVSSGVDGDEVVVPNLLGSKKSDAKRRIEQENLVVGTFEYRNSTEEKDTVIGQSVPGGDSVEEKSVINLTLSNGEAPEENDTDSGVTIDTNENNADGATEVAPVKTAVRKEKTLFITLPTDREHVNVKIVSNGEVVYEGDHNTTEKSNFSKSVSGVGNTIFEIYFDGVKVASQNIDFGN